MTNETQVEITLFVVTALILMALSSASIFSVGRVESEVMDRAKNRLQDPGTAEQSPQFADKRSSIVEQSRRRWNFARLPAVAVLMSALAGGFSRRAAAAFSMPAIVLLPVFFQVWSVNESEPAFVSGYVVILLSVGTFISFLCFVYGRRRGNVARIQVGEPLPPKDVQRTNQSSHKDQEQISESVRVVKMPPKVLFSGKPFVFSKPSDLVIPTAEDLHEIAFEADRKAGKDGVTQMMKGGAIFAGGFILSLLGGIYILAYGVVMVGMAEFVIGFANWRRGKNVGANEPAPRVTIQK